MRSSWLLLKVFRRRIGICLFIEFVILFLIVVFDKSDSTWYQTLASSYHHWRIGRTHAQAIPVSTGFRLSVSG